MKIKRIDKNSVLDFKKLVALFNKVFEVADASIADDTHLKNLLEKSSFIALTANSNQEIIGGLTAYEFPAYSGNFSEVYIYDIAVSPKHQRKGIGKALIEELKNYCRSNNIKVMFVEAHEDDKHAVEFYHTTKAAAEKVIHFNYNIG